MSELSKIYETIKVSELTKEGITIIANAKSEFIKKNGGAVEAFSYLKKVEHLVKTTLDNIKENAFNDVLKGIDYAHGVKCVNMGKTTYDYSNDKVWVSLNKKLKERENLLKAIKGHMTEVDEETGEVRTIYPPSKKVSDYVKAEF